MVIKITGNKPDLNTFTNALSMFGKVCGQAGTTSTGMRELTSSFPPNEGTVNSWWSAIGGGPEDREEDRMEDGENLGSKRGR